MVLNAWECCNVVLHTNIAYSSRSKMLIDCFMNYLPTLFYRISNQLILDGMRNQGSVVGMLEE